MSDEKINPGGPLKYSCHGLDERCERFLKSLIKLVTVRSGLQWVQDDSDYQLLIVSDEDDTSHIDARVWRQIADFTNGRGADCALISGARLEAELRSAEKEIRIQTRPSKKRSGSKRSNRAPSAASENSGQAVAYQLKRWPPTAVLGTSAWRQRVAALLIKKPLAVEDLSRATGVPLNDCREMVSRLEKAALLHRRTTEHAAAEGERKEDGFFSQIRQRLGIKRLR